MIEYTHNPNHLNFTHTLVFDYTMVDSKNYWTLSYRDFIGFQDKLRAYGESLGFKYREGFGFASEFDFYIDSSGPQVYIRFQKKEQAMQFKLGWS